MKRKDPNKQHVETMIGEDVIISGELKLSGGAIISGKIKGDVITSGIIRLTTTGIVEGNVIASEATIGGQIHGNVRAQKIILRENSKVDGDIIYRKLTIEEGAAFQGRCDLDTNDSLSDSKNELQPKMKVD